MGGGQDAGICARGVYARMQDRTWTLPCVSHGKRCLLMIFAMDFRPLLWTTFASFEAHACTCSQTSMKENIAVSYIGGKI